MSKNIISVWFWNIAHLWGLYVPALVRVLVRFHRKHTAVKVLDFWSVDDQRNGKEEYFVSRGEEERRRMENISYLILYPEVLWFSSSERKLALNFVHPIRCQVNSVSVHLQAVKKFIAFAGFYNTSLFCGTPPSKNTFKSSFAHQKHLSVKSYITCVPFTL